MKDSHVGYGKGNRDHNKYQKIYWQESLSKKTALTSKTTTKTTTTKQRRRRRRSNQQDDEDDEDDEDDDEDDEDDEDEDYDDENDDGFQVVSCHVPRDSNQRVFADSSRKQLSSFVISRISAVDPIDDIFRDST
ncbi:hypothetical protein V1477_016536 [Vespula maculifrons]|uniref:Uncharacterized protein n=1 Tax=Vespula maculifrons TaxID=7453 RepID=A0ABD2B9D8_VESMC